MANAKDLRKRITSVKNTQQITKAMKMVSAAKLRRAQSSAMALRPFAKELGSIIANVSQSLGDNYESPLLTPKENPENLLIVLITSDKGLCGAFNGNVIKTALRILKEQRGRYKKIDLAFIGKRGYDFFKTKTEGAYYTDMLAKPSFKKSQDLSKVLIARFLAGEYDKIEIIYNEFKSAISQKVEVETYLPIPKLAAQEAGAATETGMTIYEPTAGEILDELIPKHFATQLHRMILESVASEHAARMTSMENATKNAGEMMKKLSLEYNKTRQAGITKELLEIVSGSEALKG